MKFKFYMTFAFLLAFAVSAQAQRVKPQNVLEYFTALPTKYFGPVKGVNERKKTIKIQDIENGYLRLESTAWEGWGDVALFKNTDGTKTLGIQIIGCGPACGTESMHFVQYKNGAWIDVTKNVLPDVSEAELLRVMKCINPETEDSVITYYELPRYGTTVKMIDDNNADQSGKVLYEFVWNGAKFTARAKRDKACREQ